MKNLVKFVKIDIKIQQILIGITVASLIFPLMISIPLILLGAWQLFSGIYLGLKLKDSNRAIYLVFSTVLLLLMFTATNINMSGDGEFLIFSIVFIIVPFITALCYLKYSFITLDKLGGDKYEIFTDREMEEVLDSEELFS